MIEMSDEVYHSVICCHMTAEEVEDTATDKMVGVHLLKIVDILSKAS